MLLSEDDIMLGTIYGAPGSNAPLQRSTHAWADLGMATANLLEDGDGTDARAAVSIGTISLSDTPASGSGRRLPRGAFF